MIRIVGTLAAVVCGGYFVFVGVKHAQDFPSLSLDGASLSGLAGATLLFLAVMAIAGLAWHIALRATGEPPRLRSAMAAVMMSQFAKYAPGNVGHLIGRVALARHYGFKLSRVLFTIVFETSWNIVAAVVIAAVALIIEGPAFFSALPELPIELAVLVLLAALVTPLVTAWVLRHWRPAYLERLMEDVDLALPNISSTLACVMLYGLGFVLAGLALDLLAKGPLSAGESHFMTLTGAFAIAWVAGYITPGAPGGLGVREAVLVAALGPIYGPGTAVSLALIVRVCNVAAEGLGFLSGLAIRRSLATA